MKNKQVIILLSLFITIWLFPTQSLLAFSPNTTAKGAVVLEVSSGRILFQKNAYLKMPMASTTKIMTAILAIEQGNLKDTVMISDRAAGVEGSSLYLIKGEKISLENLLYGLMLRSGNDAAVAVAEHVGGNVEDFVAMMNQKALEIGAKDTHFTNPNGLHDDAHYTTAYDLALLSAYAMKNPTFRTIVSTKSIKITGEGLSDTRSLQNNNDLLWQYKGGNGIKTGYTTVSKRCLVSAASRSGMQLVCVVLNCQSWFEESMALLDYGFTEYKPTTILKTNENMGQINVINGYAKTVSLKLKKEINIPLKEGEMDQVLINLYLPTTIKAPIKKGDKIGSAVIHLGKEISMQEDIYATENIHENAWLPNIQKILAYWVTADRNTP